jgi:uncharacterized membrane protein
MGFQAGPDRPRDGWSIAALVCGIIALVPFAIAFGIAGITRTRFGRRRGRGMAIAGVVLGAAWLVVVVVVIVLAAVGISNSDHADRNADGQISHKQSVSPSALREGDCLQTPSAAKSNVTRITVMPCSDSHNGQDVADITLTYSSYPGSQQLLSDVQPMCESRAIAYLGGGHSDLSLYVFYPTANRWKLFDDHEVHCVVYDSTGPFTGDVRQHH